ncbi:hypothetical protein KEM55_004715 [Ascosphaera atra]|nr:hypothetical protein KEM55_004715 [Ascosphaera atra]
MASTNMAIVLVMMQVSKRIPFENPDVLFGVRTMYIASNIMIVMLYLYVRQQIHKKKGNIIITPRTYPNQAHTNAYLPQTSKP